MESTPKVLIGVPVCNLYEYCFDEFLERIRNLSYKNYEILLVDNSKEENFFNKIKSLDVNVRRIPYLEKMRARVIEAHNKLREYMLSNNFDYLLVLDQDIIVPKDVLEKLLFRGKDAISGLYFGHHQLPNGENKVMPFAWAFMNKNQGHWGDVRYLNDEETWNDKLIEIAFSGMGCVFLSKKVMEKIKFRYDEKIDSWDDRWLGFDLAKEGVKFYLDTNVKCKHLYLKRPFDYWEIKKKGLV
ncbi:hypothetical protein CL617_03725 [archaeon]|nr:hypothetical protein [archaeon]|tara:strand:- start:15247 stop:15972 length:726 start_codon:yes stop_codon:yes gene_type:complete